MTASSPLARICVFCGSRSGLRPGYAEYARSLGQLLGRRGIGVVYGGGSVGLMGTLADAALEADGEVIGVIPEGLVARELAHPGLTQLHVLGSMHERKALMASLSDAFIALPGGFGTLEEFFEVVTWAQLGIHAKPVGLLNANGYFDNLMAFIDQAVAEGFIAAEHAALIIIRSTPRELLDALLAYQPPFVPPRWLEIGET